MQHPSEAPQARHSAFAAAFFSLLLPGLGQMYAGRLARGACFMVPWLLAAALIAGTAFSMGLKDFGLQLGLDTAWLQYLLIGIGIDLVWRLLAVLDAFWVARAPRGVQDPPLRRIGSGVGLLAIIAVLLGSHATIATPAYGQYDALRCATDTDCVDGQAPDETLDPGASIEPLATLPPTLPPASLEPGATAAPSLPPTPEPSVGPSSTPLPDWTKGRLNVLLVGTNGALTDTLIVVSVDPESGKVAFISIPRDTVGMEIPRGIDAHDYFGGTWPRRVNEIFNLARGQSSLFPGKTDRQRGYGALKSIVGETLGIDINYYVQVDMESFRDVIETLGGALVDVQLPVYDARYGSEDGHGTIKLYIPPGVHFMNGQEALAYSRSRHTSSDFDRSARQMRMITAIRNQLDIPSLIGDIDKVQNIIKKDIRTDIPSRLLPQLAQLAQSVDLDKRISLGLTSPTYSQACGDSSSPICAENGRYALVAKVAKMRKAVKDIFTTKASDIERQQTLDSEAAVVHVLNGTSSSNSRTTSLADYLRDDIGLDSTVPPVNAGRADRDDYPDTVFTVYNGAAASMPVTVRTLERELGVEAAEVDDPGQPANMVVIVGDSTPRKP